MRELTNFHKITINLASPERIREWSYGEVKKPETINYRTLRPERDGLFCEKIFGTTKEWECYCGKFKSIRYKGVICDRCGVEVTHFKVRRERMGHIELASPVSHIWYYKSVPSRIGMLLEISINDLRAVLYFERYIVIDPGETDLKEKQLITEEEYNEYNEKYQGSNFVAEIGAIAVKHLLENLDLEKEAGLLRERMNEKGKKSDPRLLKRLEMIEDFRSSNNQPDWMILDVVPVIPPELRPMVQLDGGRFATSDLNDLYRRVLNRNNRLKRLLNLKAPEIILRNEKRMLQEAVDALFDNSRRKRVVKGTGNRPLKSLSDMLKGKQGRFRQNLLGKRVDYSGRSVIVVGPELKLHQCGLPKKMALELFKPFIMRGLVEKGLVYNIKSAKKMVEKEKPEVWGVLEEVIHQHPVMLNRAPTLHRLGIQAFEPVLVEGKAIKLHPLVCHAFNADFDGDQMAVHVPLSAESQIECWMLMLSAKNLLNPANGNPVVGPSQDMVLGVNYLTKIKTADKGEGKTFSSIDEIYHALNVKAVGYQARIKVQMPNGSWLETTPGRIIFNEVLPDDMDFVNDSFEEKSLNKLIGILIKKYGTYTTVEVLDKIKELGFKYATIFGATIGIDDVIVPSNKKDELKVASEKVLEIENQYRKGLITNDERYNKVVDVWTSVNDKIADQMMDELKKDKNGFNPLYIMANSGARGSRQQIKQLAGMRGLMAKPSGEIMELPIKSNFKEGLTVSEYFNSTHGARKGLADTALKTADAGYLTRRLVDIAQDVVINEPDCETINGLEISAIIEGDEIIESLSDRIVGRFSLDTINHPKTKEVIVERNTQISEEQAAQLENAGIERVRIRSVLTCEARYGVCIKCYGRNLATGKLVEVGEAVGTIAAQSIGQPGTQLTMRTFHIGGTAAKQIEESQIKLNYDAIIKSLPENIIQLKKGQFTVSRKSDIYVQRIFTSYNVKDWQKVDVKNEATLLIGDTLGVDKNGQEVKSENICTSLIKGDMLYLLGPEHKIILRTGTISNVKIGQIIPKSTLIGEFDPYNEPIISEVAGEVSYKDILRGVTLKLEVDAESDITNHIIVDPKDGKMNPSIVVKNGDKEEGTRYSIPGGAFLTIEEGEKIEAGKILAKIPREQVKTKDITGGLPRVAELFEARKPKNACIVAEQDGHIKFGERLKGKQIVLYVNHEYMDENGELQVEAVEHKIPANKRILVRENEYVHAGDQLSDGPLNPHDILKIKGDQKLQEYLLNEIQEVYRLQGVHINDKHIGIIIRQMLRKVEISDVGDTNFILGQQVDKYLFREENKRVRNEGGQPASAKTILLGITKASSTTESFFSAASFQETTKALTNAAIKGKADYLRGLKENVIIGRRIPAGTGIDTYEDTKVIYLPDRDKEEENDYFNDETDNGNEKDED